HAGILGAVPRQEHPRRVQSRHGRRRDLSRDDQRHERVPRDPQQRASRGTSAPHRPRTMTRRLAAVFVLLLICVCARVTLHAAQAGQASGSQWQFNDDDEKPPTLAETLKSQWVDIAVFSGFTMLALVSFFRKDKTLKYVA